MPVSGLLLDPKRFAVHDGPGVRTTFFLKGCPLHCLWCHNPESISPKPQTAFFEHKCLHCGECVSACGRGAQTLRDEKHEFIHDRCTACGTCEPVCLGNAMKLYGRRMTVDECMAVALEDAEFYRNSGGGVTLSGGEPLFQPDFALAFLAALKKAGIHTALDTCAFVPREALAASLPLTDIYLVDFKHADSETHRRLTGQPNERIKENLRFLSESGAQIEIRIPFVPGCSDSDENMRATGDFLGGLRLSCVKLLPYHALARTKYRSLHMPDTMPRVEPPSDERIAAAVAILQSFGVPAKSGKD